MQLANKNFKNFNSKKKLLLSKILKDDSKKRRPDMTKSLKFYKKLNIISSKG